MIKPKICKICSESFIPMFSTTQKTCKKMRCIIELVNLNKEKKLQRDIKAFKKSERKDLRERKEALKSRSDWLKEAQVAFNAYIRERDKGNLCISCGKSEAELKIKNPIAMVCGHFLSVGGHPELRFQEYNANLQCTRCNGGAGKYGQFNSKGLTVTQDYKINLIDKIGLSNVEWLEGKHEAQNWQVEDIKEIKAYYREQLKQLKG